MNKRAFFLLFLLVILILHLFLFPSVNVEERAEDQFCLNRGCTRQIKIVIRDGIKNETVLQNTENCLSSYSIPILGPCLQHDWVTYHGGGSKFRSGIEYYFTMSENSTFSGSNRNLVTLGMQYQFNFCNTLFSRMYRNDQVLLNRMLIYIFSRLKDDKWAGYNDFFELVTSADLMN